MTKKLARCNTVDMLFIFSSLVVLILYISLKASGKHCGMLTCWHVDILAAASGLEGAHAFQYVRTLTHRRVQKNQSVTVLKYFYWFRYHWNSRVPVPNSREFSSTCTNFFQYRYLNLFWYQILPVPFLEPIVTGVGSGTFISTQMFPVPLKKTKIPGTGMSHSEKNWFKHLY